AEADALPSVLDEVLTGSLWARSLAHLSPDSQSLHRALLLGRARHIWNSSTPAQRRGYFAAGVGLKAGHYLDAQAATLNTLLVAADAAVAARLEDRAVAAMIAVAEIVFETTPFRPRRLPNEWRGILERWVEGASMSEIRELADDEGAEFVEDVLV